MSKKEPHYKQFLKKNFAVHCKTIDEWKSVWHAINGRRPSNATFETFDGDACVNCNGSYCNLEWYKDAGLTILSAAEFFGEEKAIISEKVLEDSVKFMEEVSKVPHQQNAITFLTQNTPYKKAMIEALKISNSRGKKYGDAWKNYPEYHLMALVREKMLRLERNFENPKEEDYEGRKDTLIDLINWAYFYLENVLDDKYNKKDED